MSLTPRRDLYEVLIRFNPDGSYSCHQKYITHWVNDQGRVEPGLSRIESPEALNPENVEAILSSNMSAMLADHAATKATIGEYLKRLQDAEAKLAAARPRKVASKTAGAES
jgi:hypothetical protein